MKNKDFAPLLAPGVLADYPLLPRRDSNPELQNQNLTCCHYTTRQRERAGTGLPNIKLSKKTCATAHVW